MRDLSTIETQLIMARKAMAEATNALEAAKAALEIARLENILLNA